MELNKCGVNAKIKANILPEEKMREIGFTDFSNGTWYFCRMIKFKKERKGCDISFSVTIPKNGDDFSIDVLDEAFLQPYDYQYMLENDPTFEYGLIVKEQVEEWMKYLQDKGVLSGHKYGEYI